RQCSCRPGRGRRLRPAASGDSSLFSAPYPDRLVLVSQHSIGGENSIIFQEAGTVFALGVRMSPRRFLLCLTALSGFFAAPALAQSDPTRDDVLANVERCGGITDNRIWLNCFYGA